MAALAVLSAFRITIGGGGGGAKVLAADFIRVDASSLGVFGSAAVDMGALGLTTLGTGGLAMGDFALGVMAGAGGAFLVATTRGGGGERRANWAGACFAAAGFAGAGKAVGAGGADEGARVARVTVVNGTAGIFAAGRGFTAATGAVGRGVAADEVAEAMGRAGAGRGALRVIRRTRGIRRKFGICNLRLPKRPAKSSCRNGIGDTEDILGPS